MLFWRRKKGALFAETKEPSLKRRWVNTVLLLLFFRLLANIPVANVDEEQLHELLKHNPLLGIVDLFAGGEVLTSFSIVAVGLFPYLIATGVVHLAAHTLPTLRTLEKETEAERFKLYTQIATLPLAFILAWGITRTLELESGLFPKGLPWFTGSRFLSTLLVVSIVTAGSWLTGKIKDWITEHGIGSGESAILVVGSSLSFVTRISDLVYAGTDTPELTLRLMLHAAVGLGVVLLSVPLARTIRHIPLTLMRREIPGTRFPGHAAFTPTLPFLLNRGGTAPVSSAAGSIILLQIVASAIAWIFPERIGTLLAGLLLYVTQPDHGAYWAVLAGLVFAFTYVSNYSVLWKPYKNSEKSLAEYLRTEGNSVFITRVRPGAQSEAFLSRMMARFTFPAAVTLTFLAAGLPYAIWRFSGENASVAILAVVVFVKSFLSLRESYRTYCILDQPYEGLLKKGKIRERFQPR